MKAARATIPSPNGRRKCRSTRLSRTRRSIEMESFNWESGFRRLRNFALPIGSAKRNLDRKSTRLNSSHDQISYAVFCLKKKKKNKKSKTSMYHEQREY